MTVSLISAPVLCFDLVRHPRGAEIADVLLWALCLSSADHPSFERRWSCTDHSARDAAWARIPTRMRGSDATVLAAARVGIEGVSDIDESTDLVALAGSLRHSAIYDLDDLRDMLQSDIIEAESGVPDGAAGPAATVEVLMDAIATMWLDVTDRQDADLLLGPYVDVRAELGERTASTLPPAVHEILEVLQGMGPSCRARFRAIAALLGPGNADWASAVHEASWAVVATGRVREAAAAQLLAVMAFIGGGLTAEDGARGIWNLVSGAVAGRVAGDVLAESAVNRLDRGWRAAAFGF